MYGQGMLGAPGGPSQPATIAAPSLFRQLAGLRGSTLLRALSTRAKLFSNPTTRISNGATWIEYLSWAKSVHLGLPQQSTTTVIYM